ncbi:MAG: bacterial transcriptional activator domain-containing protein [Caldilineaceae bacterium]
MAWRRDLPQRIDVALLETALDRPDVAALRQVVDLYRGEFLEGFYVRDTPEFELWMARERAHLRERFMVGLAALAHHDADAGDLPQAIAWTRRMVAIEPWREEAHRNLMRYLDEAGQRGAALAQFETCRKVLAAELGVEPEAATLALVEQIRADITPPRHQADARSAKVTPKLARPKSNRPIGPQRCSRHSHPTTCSCNSHPLLAPARWRKFIKSCVIQPVGC